MRLEIDADASPDLLCRRPKRGTRFRVPSTRTSPRQRGRRRRSGLPVVPQFSSSFSAGATRAGYETRILHETGPNAAPESDHHGRRMAGCPGCPDVLRDFASASRPAPAVNDPHRCAGGRPALRPWRSLARASSPTRPPGSSSRSHPSRRWPAGRPLGGDAARPPSPPEALVAGQDHRSPLVAPTDELEEQRRRPPVDREVPIVVKHELPSRRPAPIPPTASLRAAGSSVFRPDLTTNAVLMTGGT